MNQSVNSSPFPDMRLSLRRLTGRFLHLIVIFLPLFFCLPQLFKKEWQDSWYRKLVHALERAGATFIKLGQIASSRPDMIPADLCRHLQQLQDDAPAHSRTMTENIVAEAFGRPLLDIFMDLPENPIASDSIAQVYRSTLRSGEDVAVKVRHPGLERTIALDIRIIEMAARLADRLPSLHWLNLEGSARQFGETIRNQLDLSVEANNLRRFSVNFAHNPDIVFPQPIDPWVAPSVLVETFEEATPIKHILNTGHGARTILARQGLNALLQMIFVDGYVHADMHPGNILVQIRPDGSPKTVLLDTGMVATLADKDRANFLGFFTALASFDGRMAARLMIDHAPAHDCRDPEAFARELDAVFCSVHTRPLAEIEVAALISQVMILIRRHRIKMESAFTSVNVAIMVVEGLGRQLDPELNLLIEAAPFLGISLN